MGTQENTPKKKIDGVTKKEEAKEENFFTELDKEKKSFSGFWIFLIIILIVIFSILVWGAVRVRRLNIGLKAENGPENVEPFLDRISEVRGFGVSTLGFNEVEFVEATGANGNDFPLKNTSYEITKDNITLRGKLKDSIVPLNLKIKLIATVKDELFSFIVAPNSFENIVIYGQPKEKIEKTINDNINDALDENHLKAYGLELSGDRIELKVVKEKE